MTGPGLTALVVDDERPALSELAWLLDQDERVAEVIAASSGTQALTVLEGRDVDVIFSDISMPGLDGMALARVVAKFSTQPHAPDETIPVELGGVTRFITRRQIRYAQAQGDYARLHTENGSHLVRIPLSTLEEQWGEHGFVRIHRSTLVALPHVSEVRMDHGRCSVVVGTTELQVSRRHTKALRDLVLRRQGRP